MGKAMNVLVAVVALAAVMLRTTEAKEYKLDWSIPSGGVGTYEAWAAKHTFETYDDSITFEFPAGEQDVALVTKEDFESCTTTHPILESDKPVNVGIVQPGTFYFISTFAGHCTKGQKVATRWTNSTPPMPEFPSPFPSSTATIHSALPVKFHSK